MNTGNNQQQVHTIRFGRLYSVFLVCNVQFLYSSPLYIHVYVHAACRAHVFLYVCAVVDLGKSAEVGGKTCDALTGKQAA